VTKNQKNLTKQKALNKEPVDTFGVEGYNTSDTGTIDMTLDIKEVEGKLIAKRGRIPGRIENSKLMQIK